MKYHTINVEFFLENNSQYNLYCKTISVFAKWENIKKSLKHGTAIFKSELRGWNMHSTSIGLPQLSRFSFHNWVLHNSHFSAWKYTKDLTLNDKGHTVWLDMVKCHTLTWFNPKLIWYPFRGLLWTDFKRWK